MSIGAGYAVPRSVSGAVDALRELGPAARVVAGGTDLVVALRRSGEAPPLVDVTRIPDLLVLDREPDGAVRVGAAVTLSRVARSDLVCRFAPVLARAAARVGAPQVRNLGTLGGNAANAAVAADTLPALAALSARFEVAGPAGTRVLDVGGFFLGPGRTALGPGELLVAILVPPQPAHGAAFLKVGRRRAAAISRLSVAVMVNPATGWARVSVGAVFPRPRRVEAAEAALARGVDGDAPDRAGRAAEAAVREASGDRPSMAYKLPAVRAAVADAVGQAAARQEVTR